MLINGIWFSIINVFLPGLLKVSTSDPSTIEFKLRNSDLRPYKMNCSFGNCERKPFLNVSSESFGGAGKVDFRLLSKKELRSLKTYTELMPEAETLGKALVMLGDKWIHFLADNKFVENKSYLADFIEKDAKCELEAFLSSLSRVPRVSFPPIGFSTADCLKILKDCKDKSVGNEERMKTSFFSAILPGHNYTSALTDDNFNKLAFCLMYVPHDDVREALQKCIDLGQPCRLNEKALPEPVRKWLKDKRIYHEQMDVERRGPKRTFQHENGSLSASSESPVKKRKTGRD